MSDHPDVPNDAAFWMAIEARFGKIERALSGGLTGEQVFELRAQAARLAAQLRNSRILLAGAIRSSQRQLQPKGTTSD